MATLAGISAGIDKTINQALYGDTANNNAETAWSHADHHKAIFEAIEGAVHRSHDNIVCSFIAMFRTINNPGHSPWTIEAETVRALVEVLDRNGYTASGRRFNSEPVTNSEARKAT